MKSRIEEDLQEILVVPGSIEAFVFDSELFGVVVFEKAQGGAAHQAEVGGSVAFAEAGLVFLKRHVQLPMQLVLDAPVTANGFGERLRRTASAKRRAVSFLLKMSYRTSTVCFP